MNQFFIFWLPRERLPLNLKNVIHNSEDIYIKTSMSIGKTIAGLIKWRARRIDLIGNNLIRNFSYLLNIAIVLGPFLLICIGAVAGLSITTVLVSYFAVFSIAAILPVILSYSIGVIKEALNYKLFKELNREGIESSRIKDLFVCVKDLEFTVNQLGTKRLMQIFDADNLNANDIRQILNDKEIVSGLSFIHEDKLKFILILNNNNLFNGQDIIKISREISSNQKAVNGLNSIHENKLELIFNSPKLDNRQIVGILSNQLAIGKFNSIPQNKLELILNSTKLECWKIERILSDILTVNGLNSIRENKLELILDSPRLDSSEVERILGSRLAINELNSIDDDSLTFMLNSRLAGWEIRRILRDQEVINQINADFSLFKTIVNDTQLSGDNILFLYKNKDFGKTKRNLVSALLLYEMGYIPNITIGYILNDNKIEQDVIDCSNKPYDGNENTEDKVKSRFILSNLKKAFTDCSDHPAPRLGVVCVKKMITEKTSSRSEASLPSL